MWLTFSRRNFQMCFSGVSLLDYTYQFYQIPYSTAFSELWPLCSEYILGKIRCIFAFPNITQYWGGTGSWNPALWKTRNCQYHGCWWLGDERSQDISSSGIEFVLEYSDFRSSKLNIEPWTIHFLLKWSGQLISPWTKWLPFQGWCIQMHFYEWKILYFD